MKVTLSSPTPTPLAPQALFTLPPVITRKVLPQITSTLTTKSAFGHMAGAASPAALQAIHAGNSIGNNQSVILVWYDSTNTVTTVSYVDDSGTAGSGATATTMTLEDVAAGDIGASFAAGNFGVESLG